MTSHFSNKTETCCNYFEFKTLLHFFSLLTHVYVTVYGDQIFLSLKKLDKTFEIKL